MSTRTPTAPIAGEQVLCRVEVPRGGRVKWSATGTVDFVSPFACPFNYGSAPERAAPDGDPLDVVLLGPDLPRGAECTARVWAWVDFEDAGTPDPKWICGPMAPAPGELARVARFFRLYARLKAPLNQIRGKRGPTRYRKLHILSTRD